MLTGQQLWGFARLLQTAKDPGITTAKDPGITTNPIYLNMLSNKFLLGEKIH